MIFYENIRVFPYSKPWVGGVDYIGKSKCLRVKRGGTKNKYIDNFGSYNSTGKELGALSGRFLYGGPFYNHFGHFMTDTIIRLYAFDPSVHDGVVFPCVMRGLGQDIPEFVYEVFDLYGIPREKAIFIKHPCVISRLDVVDRSSALMDEDYADWYYPKLREIKEGVLKRKTNLSESFSLKKLYLGRSHLLSKGTVFGESYLSRFIHKCGYHYFRPENFSIIDQANILLKADDVIFMEGSSIYSTELLDKLDASCFMISRRSNGGYVFKRQLDKFSSHGSSSGFNVRRLVNNNDGFASTSPSFVVNVNVLRDELCGYLGIDSGLFSLKEFLLAEYLDAMEFYKNNELLYKSLKLIFSYRCSENMS